MTEDEGRMSDNNKLRDLKLEIPLDEIPFDLNKQTRIRNNCSI